MAGETSFALTGEHSPMSAYSGIVTDREPRLRGPEVDRLVAVIRVGICPWADGPNSVEYKDEHIRHS